MYFREQSPKARTKNRGFSVFAIMRGGNLLAISRHLVSPIVPLALIGEISGFAKYVRFF